MMIYKGITLGKILYERKHLNILILNE